MNREVDNLSMALVLERRQKNALLMENDVLLEAVKAAGEVVYHRDAEGVVTVVSGLERLEEALRAANDLPILA